MKMVCSSMNSAKYLQMYSTQWD